MKRFAHVLQNDEGTQEGAIGENDQSLRSDHERTARGVELRHTKIARLAHYIWQSGGEQAGQDQVNWLIAEHIFETARFTTVPHLKTRAAGHPTVRALSPIVSPSLRR